MAGRRATFFAIQPNRPRRRTTMPSLPSLTSPSEKRHREKNWFPPAFLRRYARQTADSSRCFHFPPPPQGRCLVEEILSAVVDNCGDIFGWSRQGCPGSCLLASNRLCKWCMPEITPPADK